MTDYQITRAIEIEDEIASIEATEVLVASNAGTYSALEAHRAVGTGDPTFASRRVYERVGDGRVRVLGPDLDEAPGRVRHMRAAIATARARLNALRAELAEVRS